jgi:hypothetical protein
MRTRPFTMLTVPTIAVAVQDADRARSVKLHGTEGEPHRDSSVTARSAMRG